MIYDGKCIKTGRSWDVQRRVTIVGATSIQELNGYVHRSVDVVLGLSNYILAALMVAFGAVQLIYAYTD